MPLEVIYVVRHGFRSNWLVDPSTGDYKAYVRSPTGIAADPALTSHGVDQARELAAHLAATSTDGALHGAAGDDDVAAGMGGRPAALPVERIYCSPYYRCLQTIQPFVQAMAARERETAKTTAERTADSSNTHKPPWWAVRCEPGLVDWFGPAPFEHPQPAPVSVLQSRFFPWIDVSASASSSVVPPRHGETMAQLHARVAACLDHIVRQCDADGVRTVLLCSHAAPIIALGRVLTGRLPDDVAVEDFGVFTCGLSLFRRRHQRQQQLRSDDTDTCNTEQHRQEAKGPVPWDDRQHTLAGQAWTHGRGIAGGWDCEVNCDCSFLSGGEERGCTGDSVVMMRLMTEWDGRGPPF
ncbi:phosphoglycerate mutase family protein [Grosmannia clavigera kw1407]|uniref:Phosphoglycerate mutase family protein n=1 Tax=Grosmannia clavigera (strain kw1407 / UAMH 11150) TaxID=655863 RepID=F0XQ66_GROCL|nr:phosphoglycerate mutase family protein [Grosmannia clavigera kw1407]EFX00333.1 phosphoglycerate mutase family protein [Grosmannia clavigera kw1407]